MDPRLTGKDWREKAVHAPDDRPGKGGKGKQKDWGGDQSQYGTRAHKLARRDDMEGDEGTADARSARSDWSGSGGSMLTAARETDENWRNVQRREEGEKREEVRMLAAIFEESQPAGEQLDEEICDQIISGLESKIPKGWSMEDLTDAQWQAAFDSFTRAVPRNLRDDVRDAFYMAQDTPIERLANELTRIFGQAQRAMNRNRRNNTRN